MYSIEPDEFTKALLDEDFENVYEALSNQLKNIISSEDFIETVRTFNKAVDYYQVESITNIQGLVHYVWSDNTRKNAISAIFDNSNQVHQLFLKPFITFPESDSILSKNRYSMPIEGEWSVVWGGLNEFINHHYQFENQRYAYDLVQMKNNLTYKETPTHNEDYFAFNEKVIAPATGKVIEIIDDIPDNNPGTMNEEHLLGNAVIIEHDYKEYSLIAHLKQGSIPVHKGQFVE
ncbi:M23 family metallopeptidase [Halalkalibacillus halophilus]|uniref:M23 family metallopeptidase n=1 Tax=Halalkalibacillus halophilus TaxID=392827 RepID=UPI0004137432|nr:M23 family metallopeptidase [Halalkalibacillus halophilus]